MIKKIRAEEKLSVSEIETIINGCVEFDTVAFEGVFRFEDTSKHFFMLGKNAVESLIMVTKPNLRLDFSKAKIFYDLKTLTCKTVFLTLYQTARNVRIIGLDLQIRYIGEATTHTLYGLYNFGHSLLVDRCNIEIYAEKQINTAALANYGGIDTPLDTQADNLSVNDSRIKIHIQPKESLLPCEVYGIHNYFANSIQISDTYIEVRNCGNGSDQRAVGLYNNGRFCRFSNNNVKANGGHNAGVSLEQAYACGMIDEGMYSLISNSNLVGEWGGSCIGLLLKGEYAKVNGCKILSTHTIKGTTVRIEGHKIILSDNILTSTSRNARIIYTVGSAVTICGNFLEVLMNPDICKSGVGVMMVNCSDTIVADNQFRNIKNCGIYSKQSRANIHNNVFRSLDLPSDFKEVMEDDLNYENRLEKGENFFTIN